MAMKSAFLPLSSNCARQAIALPRLIDGSEIAVNVNHGAGRARVVIRRPPKVKRAVLSLDAQMLSPASTVTSSLPAVLKLGGEGKSAARGKEHQACEKQKGSLLHGVATGARRVTRR